MLRNIKKVAVLALAGLTLAACATEAPDTAANAGGADGTDGAGAEPRVVMLLNDQFDPYYLTLAKGAEEKAAELGVDFSWQAPTTLDVAAQTQLLQSIAATKPDGIIMSALDAKAMSAPMRQVNEQGIPIVTVDADVEDQNARLATFKSDGVVSGEMAADTVNELLAGTGKVGYVGYIPGIQSVDIRLKGWQEQLKKHSGLENSGEEYAGADISENVAKTSALISRVPDLKAVFASWTNAAIGAAKAVQQAGKTGDIKVVGVDASPDQVDLLRQGLVDALVVQKPYDMGKDAVEALAAYTKDGTRPQGEKLYDFVVATKDNLDTPEISQYLYVKPEGK